MKVNTKMFFQISMQRTGTILICAAFEMVCFSDLKDKVQVSSVKVIYHEQMCNNLLIDTQNTNWAKPKGRANQRPVLPVVLSLQDQWVLAAPECPVKPLVENMWNKGQRITKHNSGTC